MMLPDTLLCDVTTALICSMNDTIYRFTYLNNAIHRYIPIYDMLRRWLQYRLTKEVILIHGESLALV